ncbi:unnamed protein product [Calicophoron daubneyi]|uniref:Uncharacterized protein n=1 Tax=Calicophoron daubneyi TaxID=300641 RepID=A0AAV2TWI7_CALDB
MSHVRLLGSVLKWLRTFEAARNVTCVEDISDGCVLARVLSTISPKHFPTEWRDKIDCETGTNWRTKVGDEPILIRPEPDLVAIAEHNDPSSAFRLLQLVLGCAVNCETKETYIQAIMCMEQSVQQALMETIQQLMSSRSPATSDSYSELLEGRLGKDSEEYKTLLSEKEQLAQKYHELILECSSLREEKAILQMENERLQKMQGSLSTSVMEPDSASGMLEVQNTLIGASGIDSCSLSPLMANVRIHQLQDQVSKLRDELYRAESTREDLKIQLADAVTNNQELKQKCDLLAQRAEEVTHLKDELDIAREELASISSLSAKVGQLRKRADEAVELRVRCAKLEADNKVCAERLAELEQENRLGGNLRSQAETQRMHAADAHLEATQALERADALETELRKVKEEFAATIREKTRLVMELNRLRSCCEELQTCVLPPAPGVGDLTSVQSDTNLQFSPAMQSQMLNLRDELTRLRISFSSLDMCNTSNEEDKTAGSVQEINDIVESTTFCTPDSGPNGSMHSSTRSLMDDRGQDSAAVLRIELDKKTAEFAEMEQKYRGYLWKAREVIRLLERQRRALHDELHSGLSSQAKSNNRSDEIERLRSLVVEKESIIEKLEQHLEQTHVHRDAEERILMTAWYNLAASFTREAIEQQMLDRTQPVSTSSHQPLMANSGEDTSFLARQREIHLKPPRGLTSMVTAHR